MKKVFLDGTWDGSDWREKLIPQLKIDYFDPVMGDRQKTPEEKAGCSFLLYVITPEMNGFYEIAEAVQSSNRRPEKTIFCALDYGGKEFDGEQWLSISAIAKMIEENGAKVFTSLGEVARYLNQFYVEIPYDPNVVECLIKRDGPTIFTLGRNSYKFEKNDAGHSVCLVMLKEHREYLTRLPDYRIYMKHLQPKPEFDEDELDFIREWSLKGADSFLAYVNGRVDKFNNSRSKVRARAIEKWRAVMPKDPKAGQQMECPIRPPVEEKEESGGRDWLPMNADQFKRCVEEEPELFISLPEDELAKAQNKWDRLVYKKTGEPWPIKAA